MIVFAQACDSNYGAMGLALFESLRRHMTGEWGMLWVALDRDLENALLRWRTRLYDKDAHAARRFMVVGYNRLLESFPGLPETLASRTKADPPSWYWTMGPHAAALAVELHPEADVAYLDSDCYAFADLRPAVQEVHIAGADVGVVGTRFPETRSHQHSRADVNSGTLTTFRPTTRGRAAASWWAAYVRGRCELQDSGDDYLGLPPGRAGDQAPLDVIEHLAVVRRIVDPGIGLAPYNWDAARVGPGPVVTATSGGGNGYYYPCEPTPVRLAHMHEYRVDAEGNIIVSTGYPLPDAVAEHVVDPWQEHVRRAAVSLAS